MAKLSNNQITRIGVISDTHGTADPRICKIFQGVDLIIHAGDIGPGVLTELETIAPVSAVQGNMDRFVCDRPLHEIEIIEIAQKKLLVTHIYGFPRRITKELQELTAKLSPDVIIFGHSHYATNEIADGKLYLNPGSAGSPRFALKRSLAILTISSHDIHAEIIHLD